MRNCNMAIRREIDNVILVENEPELAPSYYSYKVYISPFIPLDSNVLPLFQNIRYFRFVKQMYLDTF
jgi:hypothetical protein